MGSLKWFIIVLCVLCVMGWLKPNKNLHNDDANERMRTPHTLTAFSLFFFAAAATCLAIIFSVFISRLFVHCGGGGDKKFLFFFLRL